MARDINGSAAGLAGRRHVAAALGDGAGRACSILTIIYGRSSVAELRHRHRHLLHRPQRRRDRDHGAAADADRHHRRDRPVGGVDARPVQHPAGLPVRSTAGRSGRRWSSCSWSARVGGALNGVLITKLGLPSIAVTIGTLTLFRGHRRDHPRQQLGQRLPDLVHQDRHPADPAHPARLLGGHLPGAGDRSSAIVLHATPIGRSIFAIGLQQEAAFFSGIRVNRIKFWLYVLSGVVCAFAGILWTFRFATSRFDAGTGLELNVVAIVLLGGVSIFGGRGSILGVVLAAAVLGLLPRRADPDQRVRAGAEHRHRRAAAAQRRRARTAPRPLRRLRRRFPTAGTRRHAGPADPDPRGASAPTASRTGLEPVPSHADEGTRPRTKRTGRQPTRHRRTSQLSTPRPRERIHARSALADAAASRRHRSSPALAPRSRRGRSRPRQHVGVADGRRRRQGRLDARQRHQVRG